MAVSDLPGDHCLKNPVPEFIVLSAAGNNKFDIKGVIAIMKKISVHDFVFGIDGSAGFC